MNKRHYEHTLPNIRGSLSNTYGSSRIAFNRAVSGNVLFLFNMTVCFNYNDMFSGSKVRWFVAIALRYTIKREWTLRISHPECPLR